MPVFAALISGILGLVGSRQQAKRQEKAAAAERQATIDAERRSQAAQRDRLRQAGSTQSRAINQENRRLGEGGSGSAFGSQLQALTGR